MRKLLRTLFRGRAILMVGVGIALLSASVIPMAPTRGADHKDSPSVENDSTADIADIFAFRSPENNDNLVVVMTVNPLTAPPDNANRNFASDVTFRIIVDNTGDLNPDATAEVEFSGDSFTITGLGSQPIMGQTTPPGSAQPMVTTEGPIKAFAGQRDDPFFFDLVGFQRFVANPMAPASGLRPAGESASDTFAGTNVSALVIELPITALTGAANSNTGSIKVFGSTDRGSGQIDRVAIPAVNTALVPAEQKNDFNQTSDPKTDVSKFAAPIQSTIQTLRGAVDSLFGTPQDGGPLGNLSPEQVTAALVPYVVTTDFSMPVQFPNGRRLQDDVIDTALGLVLNRGATAGISDGVDGNDKQALSAFPYLAAPHLAAATGTPSATGTPAAPAQMPNTGLSSDGNDGLNWQLPLAISGGVVLAAGVGLLVMRRKPVR